MKNKKVIIGVVVAIIIIVIALGFVYIKNNSQQSEILKQEVAKIVKLDLSKDEIDMEIKSTGNYGIVEKTIKEYLNESKIVMTEFVDLCNNSGLDKILSSENISSDGPEFTQSKKKIEEFKTSINENIEKYNKILDKENIENAINDKGVNDYYKNLYKDYMLDEQSSKNLEKTKTELQTSSEEINKLVSGIENIINFLSENKDDWKVTGGKIQFNSQEKLKQYYNLLNSI